MTETKIRNSLEAQVRECFGRVVYTHKTHAKMADRCERELFYLKLSQIVLSAITATGAVAVVFVDAYWVKVVTAAISIGTVSLNAYMKGFDPGANAQKHWQAAAEIWPIREMYLSLLADIVAGDISPEAIRDQRDSLRDKLATIYQSSPQTTSSAYQDAQNALKKLEDYTFSDQEIDAFLPRPLKLTGRNTLKEARDGQS